jgi:hypothetical protein
MASAMPSKGEEEEEEEALVAFSSSRSLVAFLGDMLS